MANFQYNRITIAGRISDEVKLAVTPSGVSYCRFTVCWNPPYKGAEPEFFTVDAWRERAEFVSRWFRRGSSICVDGRLRMQSWTDKKSGGRRTAAVIEATDIHFVDAKTEAPEAEPVEPDEIDLKNSKLAPGVFMTPGARDAFASAGENELPF